MHYLFDGVYTSEVLKNFITKNTPLNESLKGKKTSKILWVKWGPFFLKFFLSKNFIILRIFVFRFFFLTFSSKKKLLCFLKKLFLNI